MFRPAIATQERYIRKVFVDIRIISPKTHRITFVGGRISFERRNHTLLYINLLSVSYKKNGKFPYIFPTPKQQKIRNIRTDTCIGAKRPKTL